MSSKVVPIKKKYETVSAMVSHIAGDEKARSAFVVYFDDDGKVFVAEIGLTIGDVGRVLMEAHHLAAATELA